MDPACGIRYQIAVAAGKGGVGKSSVSLNLAVTLKNLGYAVGVLDADLYGPSLGRMMPLDKLIVRHEDSKDFFYPGEFQGIKIFSIEQLKSDAMIARAPIVNNLLLQCRKTILWGELDYLLVDFPPGTGDLQLTLMQEMSFSGAVLVTTPQAVSKNEVMKTAKMFLYAQIPILGVVENMAYFEEPNTKQVCQIFGGQAGKEISELLQVSFLGQIPLDPAFCSCADKGENFQELFPKSSFTKAFYDVVPKMQEILWNQSEQEETWHVELLDREALLFSWGEEEIVFDLTDLQKNCPCMACEDRGVLSVTEKVEADKVLFVGNYAIQIAFTSGCVKGIYAFSFLRKLAKGIERVL